MRVSSSTGAPLLAAVAAALLLAAAPAHAHKLKVFAAAEGTAIVGTAYFAGGAPAMDSPGRLIAPDGAEAGAFRTDAQGNFRINVASRQDWRIQVDSGDGHVAEAVVPAADLPADLPAGTVAASAPVAVSAPTAAVLVPDQVEAAVARQIVPLRRQLDALEERTRFSDIMGGIGTIFGLFGVAAWIAARRGHRS